MNSFSVIVSFYTCSDIQTHSFVNIYHKKYDSFYSVLLFSCTSFAATLERGLHFLVLLFSFAEEKSSLLSHLCSVIFLPFIYFFYNGLLSSWVPISLRSSLWHILQYFGGLPWQHCTQPFHQISNLSIAHWIFSWSFWCMCYHNIIAACILLSCWEIHSSSFSVPRTIRSVNQNHHIYTDSKMDQLFIRLKCNITKVFFHQQKGQICQFHLWYQYKLDQYKILPKVHNANSPILDAIEC